MLTHEYGAPQEVSVNLKAKFNFYAPDIMYTQYWDVEATGLYYPGVLKEAGTNLGTANAKLESNGPKMAGLFRSGYEVRPSDASMRGASVASGLLGEASRAQNDASSLFSTTLCQNARTALLSQCCCSPRAFQRNHVAERRTVLLFPFFLAALFSTTCPIAQFSA